jgi:cobalt transporter subunit CbtA
MFSRVLMTALAAGVLAGLFLFAAHMAKTTPLIVHAEVYENAAPSEAAHAPVAAPAGEAKAEPEEWGPEDGFERSAYTLLADLLAAIGLAFLLVGAMALSGRDVDWRSGLIWGLCGYAAVFFNPAFGLAPELPGMQAAELQARQIWWLGTAIVTAGGLALIFFGQRHAMTAIGALLIVLPHLIGAPAHEIHPGGVPAELAAEFAIATSVITGLFWLLLGGLTGYFYQRFES